ncbi:Cellobiose dehydrogenase [Trametes pubescens]|uniref:Cellobiose dehydrogenase n=1 Tax=Trametes pubescens TaxID=154538 RepID=A0A1M2VM31_TRAPU|nr:Cellobiose dehydrogenase [Trametes pubescens]
MTIGVILPPDATPASNEYIVNFVVPASFGWSGISMGGQMANSLLFTMWPNGNEIMLGSRWADDYVLPSPYAGPKITLLPPSKINSTHVNAIFRCQNCTAWDGGSLGSGNLDGTAVLAYVASTKTPVADPSDIDSSFTEHDQFAFFGVDLSQSHSSSYSKYIGGGASPTTTPAAPPTSTVPPSTTSGAPGALQTAYGQCGGTGFTGPTACVAGFTCVAVSAPYYSQCQPSH